MIIPRDKVDDLNQKYQKDHQVDGITFVRWLHPDGYPYMYGSGADNAIFTGFYLASASFRFSILQHDESEFPWALHDIHQTLKGIRLLTNISGTPGVLARLAFPLDGAYEKIGYAPDSMQPKPSGWGPGNTWFDRKEEGSLYESDTHFYYCRTTRDQLTGIVFGLSVAWNALSKESEENPLVEQSKALIQSIAQDLVDRLEKTNWNLKDHTGFVGDTNAHKVKDNLREALLFLNCTVNNKPRPSTKRLKRFYRFLWIHTFYYRFTRRMYAWNLRTTNAFSLWINEPDPKMRAGAMKWMKRISSFTKDEDNAFFILTEAIMGNDVSSKRVDVALKALYQLSKVGHSKFFAWQKPKGSASLAGTNGRYGPGIDILLPYWMHQYYLKRLV